MTITNYNGNLLDSKAQVIIHQVNCIGTMNSGVAKCIREKWPVVFTQYQELCNKMNGLSRNPLGTSQIVEVEPGKYVENLFGQLYYGYDGKRYTNYDAVYTGLEKIRKDCEMKGFTSLALPWNMCCGRGGADWTVIMSMISSVFKDTNLNIEIWKL